MNVPQVYRMPKGYKGDTYTSPEFRKVNEVGDELTSGTLESGEEYLIKEYEAGDVFANVGGTSPKTGLIFLATGTTPTTWTNGSVLVKIQNIALTDASIVMSVFKKGELIHSFTTDDASVEIVDEAKGIFKLADTILDFFGELAYDIEVTIGTVVKTYYIGAWTVINDTPYSTC